LCARCLGLHVGFLISAVVILLQKSRSPSGLPCTRSLVILGSMMVPAVADVALSYFGVIGSDNTRRVVTGVLFGTCLAFVIVPFVRSLVDGLPTVGRSMTSPRDWVTLLVVAMATCAMVASAESSEVLFYSLAVAGIAGIFVTTWSLIAVLTLLLTEDRMWGKQMRLTAPTIATPPFLLLLAALHAIIN